MSMKILRKEAHVDHCPYSTPELLKSLHTFLWIAARTDYTYLHEVCFPAIVYFLFKFSNPKQKKEDDSHTNNVRV